ncbi:MAG: XdhC family protein [Chloroflexi bacterium]|nr:MAG: XdhC family protein [Chloroflexota bacterium]
MRSTTSAGCSQASTDGPHEGEGEMREVLSELTSWTADKEEIALATVVETWGSSPRPLGSKMVVTRSGKMAGSVSNGCIEGAVFEEAQKVLKSERPNLAAFGVADDLAFSVGLACGGHIEVFVQPLGPVHQQLITLLDENRPATLRTNLVTGETVVAEGTPSGSELARREGDWFIEPFRRPAHLIIVGAIHIAIPLHRLAKLMGYRVTVVDARAKFATKDRFPEADEIIVAWPDEAASKLTFDNSTYVVILTHDPKFDLPALRSVLGKDVGYVGAIGSRKTNENRFAALRKEGFTEDQIARVHGPVGLDLGGRGAEETALGILAEITAVRFGGSGSFMREVRSLPRVRAGTPQV